MTQTIDGFSWKFITRSLPKSLFSNVTLLNDTGVQSGFAINQITVRFFRPDNTMEINFFTPEGKCSTANFLFPDTMQKFMKNLRHHCGDTELLKNKLGL